MAGNPIFKHGKIWDHLNDISIHMKGLNRRIKQLEEGINKGHFKEDVLIEAKVYGALQRAANKYGDKIDVKTKR